MYSINKAFIVGVPLLLFLAIISLACWYPGHVLATNEEVAIKSLRSIREEEEMARRQDSKTHGYVSWDQLVKQNEFLPQLLEISGYSFEVRLKPGGQAYEAIALPKEYMKTGRRSFYIDQQGVIHAADRRGGEATSADPTIP